MKYSSSRGKSPAVESKYAIYKGLAPDGGLYIPEKIVPFTREQLTNFLAMTYTEMAFNVLSKFLTDFSSDELKSCIKSAYTGTFSNKLVTPLHIINEKTSVLELFHGPTCAFKDVALQILPKFMVEAAKVAGDNGEKVVILVATSGDTGKAALEGFKDVEGTYVIVFYPSDGVSDVQKLQMMTQEGNNVKVCAIDGNFDDTQSAVKSIFMDSVIQNQLKKEHQVLSSANSMNWGRLVPQIVYYFSAYAQLVNSKTIHDGQVINCAVPTGNFGDILAGYYAKKLGLPINKLLCASNSNNILTDFFTSGVYDTKRQFFKTSSPSMDILISSNLERFIYDISGNDAAFVAKLMESLKNTGKFVVGNDFVAKMAEHISAACCNEQQASDIIAEYFETNHYLLDPHTAIAAHVASCESEHHTVVLATANPYKFTEKVLTSIGGTVGANEFDNIRALEKLSQSKAPSAILQLELQKKLHNDTIEKSQISSYVSNAIKCI